MTIARGVLISAIFLITWSVFFCINAQMQKKTYSPMTSDIPFIKCDVCKRAVKFVYRKAQTMKQEAPKQKVAEEALQDMVEKSCNPDKFEGEWLAKLDIDERNDALVLVEHRDIGSCKAECKTVAKACQETLGEADVDVAEELWKQELSLSKLINQVCYSDTQACAKKHGKYKSGSRKDEKFQMMTEDEKKAQEYMKKASDIPGMPNMQMYSRDEMQDVLQQEQESSSSDETDNYSDPKQEQGSIIWQTIVQVFRDIWTWIQHFVGWKKTPSDEL